MMDEDVIHISIVVDDPEAIAEMGITMDFTVDDFIREYPIVAVDA